MIAKPLGPLERKRIFLFPQLVRGYSGMVGGGVSELLEKKGNRSHHME